MPLLRGGRPLKRWRYVGAFGPDVMLCAAVAHIGPVPLAWWAVWDREQRTLRRAHASRRSGARDASTPGRGRASTTAPVAIDLARRGGRRRRDRLARTATQYIWTRKQGGVRVAGTVARRRPRARGRRARRSSTRPPATTPADTAWRWSAGVGAAADGAAVAWNLVDRRPRRGRRRPSAPSGSTASRTRSARSRFDGDLERRRFADGGRAALHRARPRARARDNLLARSPASYEQPFGTFTGALPGAGALRRGLRRDGAPRRALVSPRPAPGPGAASPHGEDTRNVVDRYRFWRHEAIVADLDARRHPFHVAIENWQHDLNIGSVVRNANAFLAAEVHIVGNSAWNRRGAMVTDRYQHVRHHPTLDDFAAYVAARRTCRCSGVDNLPGSGRSTPTRCPSAARCCSGRRGRASPTRPGRCASAVLAHPPVRLDALDQRGRRVGGGDARVDQAVRAAGPPAARP